MKKYILFFVSIGIILAIVLVYSTLNVEESKKETFSESGYILNSSSERYYFYQDETYTTSYSDQIAFYDTEGEKVTLDSNNFIHYSSGNIVALQNGVLLDLSKIDDNPILYYNVSANTEVKRLSDRYIVKNLSNDIQFEQAIWKLSSTKYIILANNLTVVLNNGTTKEVEGYVEVEYFDNEIVNIYNQEFNYQTISSNSYLELEDGIIINLGTKIISQNSVNKMALEDMTVDSDDDVTVVDIKVASTNNTTEENTVEEETQTDEETTITTGGITSSSSSSTSSTSSSSSSSTSTTIVANTTTDTTSSSSSDSDTNAENVTIDLQTAEILYEYVDNNESKVDESVTLAEPTFKLEDMEVSAVGITGTIQITDEDDLLSKTDDIIIQIINNNSGKIVYSTEEAYGIFSIPLDVETLLPDTSYTLVASATYTIDDTDYTKNFLYKTFATSSIGVNISKESYTDSSLSFNILFSDENVESVVVALLDSEGNEIINMNKTIKNSGLEETVTFEGLNSNTNYIVQVDQISYNGLKHEGENWKKTLSCITLKEKPTINTLNYSISKRDGTFTLYIEDVTDNDVAIESYTYVVYKYTTTTNEDETTSLDYDTETIIYQRETTSKEITITAGDEEDEEGIVRGTYYGFKVIANTYDNEKYVEIESSICGAFALNGVTFPSVKFERVTSDYPPTEICGWLYIIDNERTIIVDEDNPLTITYYSDVDESTLYVKRYSLDSDEKTSDSDGNEVIKIWIDLGATGSSEKGLKSNTSYTFSVYGTVDLSDGNDPYVNTYIGSAIVTTESYNSITATMETASVNANAFTVELSLDADDVSKASLTSLNIVMYEGSGDINSGDYNSWSTTITANNYASYIESAKYSGDITSLQNLLFDNTLIITPSLIGGGNESSYTEAYYQIVVTATVDGTTYTNKIPIEAAEDDDEDTDNTTYTDSTTNETYTAAYIIVSGKGTTANVTEDLQKPSVTAITNSNATKYGITYDSDLNDSTYVGYNVRTNFTNTGSLTAISITYYVWDENWNPVYDEEGNIITKTMEFTNQEYAPSAVFELLYGTTSTATVDNTTGLHRGCAYYFTYTVLYKDSDGNTVVWPTCESDDTNTYDEKTLATDLIYVNKQEPIFVFYPETSNSDSITYIYSCTDPDKALYYGENSSTDYAYLILSVGSESVSTNIEVQTDGNLDEVELSSLTAGTTYTLSYRQNLNKVKTSVYSTQTLFSQKFEGIVSCNDISISNITCNSSSAPNSVTIQLTGSSASRVAAAVVTFVNGEKEISTDFLEIEDESGYYITVSLLDLVDESNFTSFIGQDIQVEVTVYYDNGRIGFIPENSTGYATYTNSNNKYLTLSSGNLVEDNSIGGNIFSYSLSRNTSEATLGLKNMEAINNSSNGVALSLAYSSAGLKQNGNVIVQKQITTAQVNYSSTINIENLVLGIQVDNDIETTITTATLKAELVNPLNISVSELVIEIWHSKDSTATPNWSECEKEIVSVNDLSEFTLDGLSPAEYYYIRFKYKDGENYVYTYDVDTKVSGQVYSFETLATIGIDNVSVKYDAEKYSSKYLNISYYVTRARSNMYEKTRYTFYDSSGIQVQLTTDNIVINDETSSTYSIDDGTLIVTNASYPNGSTFNTVNEQINISPICNVFTIGEQYTLVITPIVTINGAEDCEIEDATTTFKIDKFSAPSIGLKMERKTDDDNDQYIKTTIIVSDKDCAIYGSDCGEYELNIYKYTNSVEEDGSKVTVYDSAGDKITSDTFNLKNNGSNYPVYIYDVDYSYNYIAILTLKYDYTNTGKDLTDDTITYTLKAIDNDIGVSIGSPVLVQNKTACEVRFYDSYYNIDSVNSITYTVYDLTDSTTTTGSYVPTWSLVEDKENGITYYKITLPVEFSTSGAYTIQMNLYVDDTLAGQIDTTFIYSQE